MVGDAVDFPLFPESVQRIESGPPVHLSEVVSKAFCLASVLIPAAGIVYIDLEFFSKEVGEGSIG